MFNSHFITLSASQNVMQESPVFQVMGVIFMIIFTIIAWNVIHAKFNITYFGCGGMITVGFICGYPLLSVNILLLS